MKSNSSQDDDKHEQDKAKSRQGRKKGGKLFDKVQAACLAFQMRRGQLEWGAGQGRAGQGNGISGASKLVHKTLCTLKQTQ